MTEPLAEELDFESGEASWEPKVCDAEEFMKLLFELVMEEWIEGVKIPTYWYDVMLVPVPKKGDLSLCVNYR